MTLTATFKMLTALQIGGVHKRRADPENANSGRWDSSSSPSGADSLYYNKVQGAHVLQGDEALWYDWFQGRQAW